VASSGSINYNQTRNEIISDSLQLLGVIGSGETATANDITLCSNFLNKMVKAWQAQGIHLWKQTTQSVTLVAETYSYTLSPRPLEVISSRYHYSSGLDREMKKLGRSEYDRLPTKTTSTGPSTAFHYTPGLTSGTLLIWPVPTSSETSDTVVVTYMQSIEDFDAAGDNPDFPAEWLECLTFNLAVKVAPAFGITLSKANPDIVMNAQQSLADLQAWDSEEGSVRITPNYRWDN
jgi:hypothetical protein